MNKLVICFIVGLLFVIPKAHSQSQTELATFLEKKGYVAIPMKKLPTGHLCIIADVNDTTATLILDTGAGATVLEEKREEKFQLKPSVSDAQAAGAGAVNMEMKKTTVKKFNMANYFLDNYEVYLMNLDHVNIAFQQMELETIDGVIGADILTIGKAIIDYENLILYLKK
jgi:hypothetical protein